MKKIYMPSNEQLDEMQSYGIDLEKYVEIKMVEAIITRGINYPKAGKLKSIYKYLQDNIDIVHAICYLYPEEIKYSELANYDIQLLEQIINKKQEQSIYNLDNLANIKSTATIYSQPIFLATIDKLAKELPNNPEYRFEYKENPLLDDIFGCKIIPELYNMSVPTIVKLAEIEPAYAVLLNQNKADKKELLAHGLNKYYQRYGLADFNNTYNKENINDNPKTRRLIKAINRNID